MAKPRSPRSPRSPARSARVLAPAGPAGRTLVLAEKPSVARDIARALGVSGRGEGCLYDDRYVVTWCVGHLVELEEPAAYEPEWRLWNFASLPMLPTQFRLRPVESARSQWAVVRALLRDAAFRDVVNACDAGREGELIFRYCYELAGARLAVRRLWVSSMTEAALREGFARLKPGSAYDALGHAARSRAEADWLVGMNATRALTLRARGASGALYTVGRVQTPTLALVVARERAIRAFVPRDYWEVTGAFTAARGLRFEASWAYRGQARLASAELAEALLVRARACGDAADAPRVESVEKKPQREPPPALFDLTSLQRTANRRFGFSAQRTLDLAQSLYESYKLVTYPRTDSRHLTADLRAELPSLFRALTHLDELRPFADALLAKPPAGPLPRVFDDKKVSDHHAIIPTNQAPPAALPRDEARLYDLIARRFLGVFFPDAVFAQTVIVVRVGAAREPPAALPPAEREAFLEALPAPPDRFTARGRVRLEAGWQAAAGIADAAREGEGQVLPDVTPGEALQGEYASKPKRTQPPPRFTDAALLGAMENAGDEVDDEALRRAMRDHGLGTPATRAATLENLARRGYLLRDGKLLVPTPLGESLLDALPDPSLASPQLTGEWEARLARMARGETARSDFMRDINAYVSGVVDAIKRAPPLTGGGSGGARPQRSEWRKKPAASARTPARRGHAKVSPAKAPGARRTRAAPRTAAAPRPAAALRTPSSPLAAASRVPPAARTDTRRTSPSSRTGATRSTGIATRAVAASVPRADAPPTAASHGPCPACEVGEVITGKRAWGCGRWREGCRFVIPFAFEGKALSPTQLRDLLARGATRVGLFSIGGIAHKGRLVLEPHEAATLRFEDA